MAKKTVTKTKNTVTKKKKKSNKALTLVIRLLSLILSVALIVLAFMFAFNVIKLGLLPKRYLFPVLIMLLAIALLLSLITIFKVRKRVAQNICCVLLVIFTIVYFVGNSYVVKTAKMFDDITNLTDKVSNIISVRTMTTGGFNELKDLKGQNVGYAPATDEEGTNRCIEDITAKKVDVNLVEYGDIVSMTADLYNGVIQGMILNDAFLGSLQQTDDFSLITTFTQAVAQTQYYTERDKSQESAAEPVDVTSEPFTVFISGNDNYGSLSDFSHSDVNMLVTVNPKTGIVLMTSIPRDFYITTMCDNQDACLYGQMDKLTHTGLYGIGTTERTLENLLGITVNYNVLANFSSLVNFVNAVGGIDVFVDQGMAVKQFFSNSTLQGVEEGWNHLDGERALAFARERHAYSTGDNQRVLNQQQVLSQLINKVCSPSILLNYSKIIDAVGGAFQTNMPASDMQKLMKFELSEMPKWQFESYQMLGYGDYQYCAALGAAAYVSVPYQESIDAGIQKIKAVYDGKSSTTVEDPFGYIAEEAYAVDTTEEIKEALQENQHDTYDYNDSYYDEEY